MNQRPSDTLWQGFGAWIREAREAQHLTQGGAAERAEIDRQQWYRIESGKSGTKRDTVIAMANALSLDREEALERAGFSSDSDDRHKLPDGVVVYFDKTSHLSDEQKDKIVDVIKTIVAGVRAEENEQG